MADFPVRLQIKRSQEGIESGNLFGFIKFIRLFKMSGIVGHFRHLTEIQEMKLPLGPLSPLVSIQSNIFTDITEIKVGFDGIAMANAKAGPALELTLKDIYLALAKVVPADPEGNTVKPNPYKMWNEVNPNLPAAPIVVVGPPPTSGTRDAFNELAIERGCKKFPGRKALKKKDKNTAICISSAEN